MLDLGSNVRLEDRRVVSVEQGLTGLCTLAPRPQLFKSWIALSNFRTTGAWCVVSSDKKRYSTSSFSTREQGNPACNED